MLQGERGTGTPCKRSTQRVIPLLRKYGCGWKGVFGSKIECGGMPEESFQEPGRGLCPITVLLGELDRIDVSVVLDYTLQIARSDL